jgi:hypothetical protein
MAGNCSLVFANGRLSLARERERLKVGSNARQISGPLTFILSPCGKGRGVKERTRLLHRFRSEELTGSRAQPNILWSASPKNPPLCVFRLSPSHACCIDLLRPEVSPTMHLQSLELLGFKSFADKTLLNFHEGVTAIVGPNGCGKSNVLDAVRWVLGEQSAKSLRGDEMADVIFNGSETRKPVGFAEVSLTFTDCAEELGIDWHDVRVTRRVYRDGNSEYLLNKTLCRLRDIQSLFADTGIGRAAYSMMEQGKIDMILSSRPEDRRTVFEEAAGVTK